MRKSSCAFALSFLVAIAWLGSQLNQPRAAEVNKAEPKQKWEYKYDLWNMGIDRGAITKDFNKLGDEGWKLITSFRQNQADNPWMYVVFKRPAQ